MASNMKSADKRETDNSGTNSFSIVDAVSEMPSSAMTLPSTSSTWRHTSPSGWPKRGVPQAIPAWISGWRSKKSSKSVTGFTREEEVDYGTINDIPFLLEESLARTAARYSKVQPWGEFVVEDDRVITGQNPTSAHAVGVALAKHLA